MADRIDPGIARRQTVGAGVEQRHAGIRIVGRHDAIQRRKGRPTRHQVESPYPLQHQMFAVLANHRDVDLERIDARVLASEIVVGCGDDRTVIAFAGMPFDRFHQGAGMGRGARRPLAVVIGDAGAEIMRPHRHEIRNADAVEVGHVGNLGHADDIEDGGGAADRGGRPDRAFDACAAVLGLPGAKPIFIAARFGAHGHSFSDGRTIIPPLLADRGVAVSPCRPCRRKRRPELPHGNRWPTGLRISDFRTPRTMFNAAFPARRPPRPCRQKTPDAVREPHRTAPWCIRAGAPQRPRSSCPVRR